MTTPVRLLSTGDRCPASPAVAARRRGSGASGLRLALRRFRATGPGVRELRHQAALHGAAAGVVSSSRSAGPSATRPTSRARAELFFDAAQRRSTPQGVSAADVDTIVTVSSTGIATPEPRSARRRRASAFAPDVERVPVFGLGCAGGVSGISHRRPARAVPAGQPRAGRRGRALHARVPARQADQGKHRRDRAVRRRRRRLRAARRRSRHRRPSR